MNKPKNLLIALLSLLGLEIYFLVFYDLSGAKLIFMILSALGSALCALALVLQLKKKNKS